MILYKVATYILPFNNELKYIFLSYPNLPMWWFQEGNGSALMKHDNFINSLSLDRSVTRDFKSGISYNILGF